MRNIVAPAALVLSLSLTAFSANAKVIAGSSEGHAVSIDLTLNRRSVDIDIPGATHGEAPSPYRKTRIWNGLDGRLPGLANSPVGGFLSQITLGGHAKSTVDGGLGNRKARGAAGIAGPMGGNDIGPQRRVPERFWDVDFDIFSLSHVAGDYDDWNMRGGAFISRRLVSLLGLIGGGPGLALEGLQQEGGMISLPELTLEDFAGVSGLTLFVNEQWRRCEASECGMWVNALRFNFDNVALPNGNNIRTLNDNGGLHGDIILGRSAARLVAVPAPATLGLFGLVLMGVTLLRKRRMRC